VRRPARRVARGACRVPLRVPRPASLVAVLLLLAGDRSIRIAMELLVFFCSARRPPVASLTALQRLSNDSLTAPERLLYGSLTAL
jgi:hypothetical protein